MRGEDKKRTETSDERDRNIYELCQGRQKRENKNYYLNTQCSFFFSTNVI